MQEEDEEATSTLLVEETTTMQLKQQQDVTMSQEAPSHLKKSGRQLARGESPPTYTSWS